MLPGPSDRVLLTIERRLRASLGGCRPSWKHATFFLLAVCFVLMQMMLSASLQAPKQDFLATAATTPIGSAASAERSLEQQELQTQLFTARKKIDDLETRARNPPPPVLEAKVDPNPLRLPPHLSAQCHDPDVITMQRWITARQRTYVETPEQQLSTTPASNPDPDPFCLQPKLVIDLLPHYYVWSEADVIQEAQEAAQARGAGSNQRIVSALPANIPNGRRPRRQTGFGLAAQLHVTVQRMIWAWKHGYTYVNLAKSAWTKGMTARPPFGSAPFSSGDTSAPIPFASDPLYLAHWRKDLLGEVPQAECDGSGWDCFFLQHTSPGCLARAREARREALQFPQVNDAMRAKRTELEASLNVLFDPDMEEHVKQPTYTDVARVLALNQRWTELHDEIDMATRKRRQSLEGLPKETGFNFNVDPLASDWLLHSANPWGLPGLSFTHGYSTAKGDLFLMSEALRWFMRPAPYMQRKLHDLLTSMQYPGMRIHGTEGSLQDDSDRSASQRGVLSIHVRRVVDQRSHVLIPIHVSFEYILLARRLAATLGLSSVFLSSDDPARIPTMKHQLGVGTEREKGLGLHVMHVPLDQMGALPQPIKPVAHSADAAEQRLAGPSAVDQASAFLESMLPEEGALHLASLYTMGIFSGAFLGTISSHWGRSVFEMQRWDEGLCSPAAAGWLLPRDAKVDLRFEEALRRSNFQNRFVDLDGDTYFIGDFKVVKHPRIPQPNSPNLDPTKDE